LVLRHVREHVADAGHELTILAGLAGMVKEAEIARALGILSQANVGRLLRCIQMYGLPVCAYPSSPKILPRLFTSTRGVVCCEPNVDGEFHSIQSNWPPQTKVPAHLDVDSLMEKMAVDKKNKGGRKAVVLLDSIGHVHREEPILVDDEVLARALSDHLAVDPAKQGLANNNGPACSREAVVSAAWKRL
jgi:pentafunctional AROM polypeptide